MSVGVALEQAGDATGAAATFRRAIELLHRAYEESEILEGANGKADALTLLGTVLHRSARARRRSPKRLRRSCRYIPWAGGNRRLRKLLMNLAGLRWRLGDIEGSARDYEEALGLAREPAKRCMRLLLSRA